MESAAEASARPLNVDEWESAAKAVLPRQVYDYYAGGAEDEVTLRANRAAYARYALRPRVLVDVSRVDASVELLGEVLPHPILLAPAAFQRLAHAEGECATARAARATDTVLVASTLSTCTIEEIAGEGGRVWFQLYVFRDRGLSREIVARAEASGARALCLTVTVPVQGRRERDARNRFGLPAGMEMANFRGVAQSRFPVAPESRLEAFIHGEFDPTLDWKAVEWLRSITALPVLLKGLTAPADARLAVEHGAGGIIVSNHGGRQLDGAEATLVSLPRVVRAVEDRIPVLVDGGIRRGSDVVKAIALGARAVLIARPYLWGLAVDGEAGVAAVIRQLRVEVERTLALLGRPVLREVGRDALHRIK